MTNRVVAVGGGPSFRSAVTSMVGGEPEIRWVSAPPEVSAAILAEDPHAIVVAPEVSERDAIALAQRVAAASPLTAVVVLRQDINNGFVPAAMRAGIRDVVDLAGEEEPSAALARAFAWSDSVRHPQQSAGQQLGQLITVFSSKGGSGKSFLSSNMAATIAEFWKQDTALVDVDLAMGDAMAYFGHQSTQHLQDILNLSRNSDAESLNMTAAKLHEHLSGFASPPNPAADAVTSEAIKSLLQSVASSFPYVVVDVPGNYGDQVLGALDVSDIVVLIAGLDVVGIRHLARAVETLRSIGVSTDRMRVVLNRADSKVGLNPNDVERVLKLKITAMIPSSRLVPVSLNEGTPVVLAEPKSEVAKSIRDLVTKLIGPPETATPHRRRLFAGK